MDLKTKLLIRNKLKNILRDKEVLDVIIFGSFVKGKAIPGDIDIAVITDKPLRENLDGFHVSILRPEDFFLNPPTLVNTLLREGYSVKYEKFFAERYKFSGKTLFTYKVASLKPSVRVKVVTTLRGRKKDVGMVKTLNGEWLADQVFIVPIEVTHLFEKFFLNFSVSFKRYTILIY